MPDVIDSAEGKLVYLALATTGETEIDELVDRLALPWITMFSLLDTLEERGVIERVGSNRVAPVPP